jgi:8-oxo-dGTP pyrophosphatase MutT (NUDIX family)
MQAKKCCCHSVEWSFLRMFDPAKPSIAVAFIVDSQGRLLLSWNEKWGAFTLPMTKLRSDPPAETPEQAAVRAAAEVLGVPARVVPGKAAKFARGLQKSTRDGGIKDYQYNVVPVEAHPDYAAIIGSRPYVWASIDKLQTGEYQPVSSSVQPLLQDCVEWGWA